MQNLKICAESCRKQCFLPPDNLIIAKIPNFASQFAPYPSGSFFIMFDYRPLATEAVFISFTFVFLLFNFTKSFDHVRICVDFGCLGREILQQNLTNTAQNLDNTVSESWRVCAGCNPCCSPDMHQIMSKINQDIISLKNHTHSRYDMQCYDSLHCRQSSRDIIL